MRSTTLVVLGLVFVAIATVFAVAVPSVAATSGQSPDSSALIALDVQARLLTSLFAPLGSAFLGAGIVIAWLERRDRGPDADAGGRKGRKKRAKRG